MPIATVPHGPEVGIASRALVAAKLALWEVLPKTTLGAVLAAENDEETENDAVLSFFSHGEQVSIAWTEAGHKGSVVVWNIDEGGNERLVGTYSPAEEVGIE